LSTLICLMAGFCESGNELLSTIKCGNFLTSGGKISSARWTVFLNFFS
jgi:hypothetical protein